MNTCVAPKLVAAPDRLDELFPHVNGLVVLHRRSAFSRRQRRAALLAGSSVPASFAAGAAEVFAEFPDASRVARTASAIQVYLSRLIAPEELADARDVFNGYLGITELDETLGSLEELANVDPEIATALLELRCGYAAVLFADRAAGPITDEAVPEQIFELTPLVEEVGRIRIAYRLRCEAMKAAAQIHSPFNWAALDELEVPKGGGALRLFTLTKALDNDLRLVEHALDLYDTTCHRPIVLGTLAQSPITQCTSVNAGFAGLNLSVSTRIFKNTDLENRARPA